MYIGIFSFRAFDRRLARLAAPISSGVRQGGGAESAPPPSGARSAEYPSGARVKDGMSVNILKVTKNVASSNLESLWVRII